MEIIMMQRQYICDENYNNENYNDENYNDAKAIKTCWTWVPIGSALKIHACAAPDDGDGDLVDGGLHDDGDGDLVDGDTVDDDINCDISDVFYLTVISPLLGSGCTVGGTASAMRMMMTVVIIKMMEGARSTFFWQQNYYCFV